MGKEWLTVDKLALAALVVLCAIAAYGVATLPPTIPTHFGNDGAVNGYGSKLTLLLLPAVGLAAAGIVAFSIRLNLRPNLPFTISPEGFERIVPLNAEMQRTLRAVLLAGFAAMEWMLLESAEKASLAPGFIPVTMAFIAGVFVVIGMYFVRIWRAARG